MWLIRRLDTLRQLSWAERGLLLEATFWLAAARLSLLLVPFRQIAPRLGKTGQETSPHSSPNIHQKAEQIGWAVRAVARRTPWESACLAQAISAKAMLRRRHLASTLYLGLAKDPSEALQAHAWLRCGAEIITGKAGHERFTVISSFAEPEAKSSSESLADPAIQMLLLASLNPTPQSKTAEQLTQLDEVGWQALVKAANKQHVSSLLLARLQTLAVTTAVPPNLLAELEQFQQKITLQNMAMYRELHIVSQKMSQENVPMIVLKGAYLAGAVYPHIGQRAMGDLDLLVPQALMPQAINVMHGLGWTETRPFTLETTYQHQYQLPPFKKPGVNFPIELHWHIANPAGSTGIPSQALWQHTVKVKVAGTEMVVFPAHVQLLHLARHVAYNHQFAFDLRSLCDIALLINHPQATIDWDLFVEKAVAWNWQRGVYLTFKLAQEFWGTAVPATVLAQLKPDWMPENMTQLARQQLLWGRENNNDISSNFSQLKSSKTGLEKIQFIVGFIFPPRSRLSWQYGVPPRSPRIWLYYPFNLGKLITRNARRTWQLLRGKSGMTDAVTRRIELAEWLANTK